MFFDNGISAVRFSHGQLDGLFSSRHPPENEKNGIHVSDRFQRRVRGSNCLEALRIFCPIHQGDARLFHSPIMSLKRSPMEGYFDYQGVNSGHLDAGPGGFVRPLNLSDRKSGNTSHTSRTSGASGITYATNGSAPIPEESSPSPAEPIPGMPTPVMPPKGLHLPGEEQYDDEDDEDDEDPEYMMVDADLSMVSQFGAQNQPPLAMQEPPLKIHHNKPVPVKVQGGRKGFVGGFVSGLRRLPRLLRNQRGQSVQRQPSHDTVLELPGFGEDSPGYDPFRAQPPAIPRYPPIPQHVPSIPASHPVTSMHYSHYTHDERSESPTSRDPGDFDDDEVDHGHSPRTDEDDDQRSTHDPSTAAHSTHHSTRYSAHHSAHHSNQHSTRRSNKNSSRPSRHQTPHPSPYQSPTPSRGHRSPTPSHGHRSPTPSHARRSPTPSRPQTALDGDTTLIHQTQNGEPEAVVVHPLPTSDYKSMGPGSLSSSSSSPVPTTSNLIQKFVNDVYNLPWVATSVTADYIPERDGRRYRGMDPAMKKTPKPIKSWYPSTHQDLDLLEEESPPQSAPVMAHRRQDGHRRALTESTISPQSAAITQSVTQSVTPSTTYSNTRRYSINSEPTPRHPRHTRDFRHAHRHRRRHRDHSRPHSPPIYPILASPQPLYLYPGPATPPVMPVPHSVLGSPSPSSKSRRGITSPAMPVYMIPVPPPVYQPMSGFPYATPQPTQSQPATIPPASS